MNLMDYREEIVAIAKANDVSWDVGRDMFLANIRNAGDHALPYYQGANEVDYLALKEQLPRQDTAEYAEMCREFNRAFEAAVGDDGPDAKERGR